MIQFLKNLGFIIGFGYTGEKFVADKNNRNSNKDMGEWASESLIVSKVRNTRKKGRGRRECVLGTAIVN